MTNDMSSGTRYKRLSDIARGIIERGFNPDYTPDQMQVIRDYVTNELNGDPKGSENLSEKKREHQLIAIFNRILDNNKLENLMRTYEEKRVITDVSNFEEPSLEFNDSEYMNRMLEYAANEAPEKFLLLEDQLELTDNYHIIFHPRNKSVEELRGVERLLLDHQCIPSKIREDFYVALVYAYNSEGRLDEVKEEYMILEGLKEIGYKACQKRGLEYTPKNKIHPDNLLREAFKDLEQNL